MTKVKAMTKVLIALCLAAATAAAQEAKVTPLMTQELAGIDGKEATMQMVEYAPGGSDAEHRHNASVFVYVLEGAVVMQVKGGQEVTLGPGQSRAMLVRQYLNYWHGHGCNCDTHVAACVIERFRLGVHTTNVDQENVI
jgi:quercetin dioxygenase-like cupin family protein